MAWVTIILIVIVIVIVICALYWFINKQSEHHIRQVKEYTWKRIPNKNNDNSPSLFALTSNGLLTLEKGESFNLEIPRYNEFYELNFYSQQKLYKSIPYPLAVNLRCNDELPEGVYFVLLRCQGNGLEIWETEPSVKIERSKNAVIRQIKNPTAINDEENYDALGREYTALEKVGILKHALVSENTPLIPQSKFISKEVLNFKLTPQEKAIAIFPNRKRTMGCDDEIYFNGQKMDSNVNFGFNIYILDGINNQDYHLTQYIYGNHSDEKLAFYVYVHQI